MSAMEQQDNIPHGVAGLPTAIPLVKLPQPPAGSAMTTATISLDFGLVRGLLSDRPIRSTRKRVVQGVKFDHAELDRQTQSHRPPQSWFDDEADPTKPE